MDICVVEILRDINILLYAGNFIDPGEYKTEERLSKPGYKQVFSGVILDNNRVF